MVTGGDADGRASASASIDGRVCPPANEASGVREAARAARHAGQAAPNVISAAVTSAPAPSAKPSAANPGFGSAVRVACFGPFAPAGQPPLQFLHPLL